MPVELVGTYGVNALKRRLRALYQQELLDIKQVDQVTTDLLKLGWRTVVCPRVERGKKSKIIFEQRESEAQS